MRNLSLLRSVIGSLGEGVVVANAQGRLLIFNDVARRYFNPRLMRRKPPQWSHAFGLFAHDEKTPFAVKDLPLIRALRGENTDGLEMFVRNARVPRGVWLELSGRPIRDAAGKIIGAVAIFRDVTDSKKAEREIVEISGREQRRIGQDLHDGLCQTLLAAQFTVKALSGMLPVKSRQPRRCLREVQEHLKNAVHQADAITRGLYPVELDTRGLMAALEELALNMSRVYRVECRLFCPRLVKIADSAQASHLYRITQEAVFNAIKNGKARHITIRLQQIKKETQLSVIDDGVGISKKRNRTGMGLILMAYRARIINAELSIRKMTRGGTAVRCVVRTGFS